MTPDQIAAERRLVAALRGLAAELGPDLDAPTLLAYCAGLEAGWPTPAAPPARGRPGT